MPSKTTTRTAAVLLVALVNVVSITLVVTVMNTGDGGGNIRLATASPWLDQQGGSAAAAAAAALRANAQDSATKGGSTVPFPSKYPWSNGIELASKPHSPVHIEAYFSPTCSDSAKAWSDIWVPLLQKYNKKISFVLQPFALPYQPYSYDSTLALYAVYHLLGNSSSGAKQYLDIMFNEQLGFSYTYTLSQELVWKQMFGSWAEGRLGVPTSKLIQAMKGEITNAHWDAMQSARYCRQRSLPGAPSYVVNGWMPPDIDLTEWTREDWEMWINNYLSS